MTRREVLISAVGLAVVASGAVVVVVEERRRDDRRPVTVAAWDVMLTRAANGLPASADAVRAAAAAPAPQLLVDIPLTAAEATLLRARRDAVPLAVIGRLFDQTPAMTRLGPRGVPPSARTVQAWLTRPDRVVADQLHDHVGVHVPVEVHLTRWSRADLERQWTAVGAALPRLARAGIEVSSVAEPTNAAAVEVMTPRALTPAQQDLIRELAPAAVFTIGSTAGA